MPERLIIRFDSPSGDLASWMPVDNAGHAQGPWEQGTLEMATAKVDNRRAILLVPGAEVLLTQVRVPSRNRKRIAQAVPYALEEQLSEDVDALHFGLGQQAGDGSISLAVVSRERMDQWQSRLQSAQLEAHEWIPETLAVPCEAEEWSVLVSSAGALMHTGGQSGFATDLENLPTLLRLALQEVPSKPRWIRVLSSSGSPVPLLPRELDGVEIVQQRVDGPPIVCLAQKFSEKDAIYLLRGPYSRRVEKGKQWLPWRGAAMLFGAWLLIEVANSIAHYWQLTEQSQILAQRINSIYRQAFPETRRIVNPRVQMEQGLAALRKNRGGTGGNFLELFARIGKVLKETPGLQLLGARYQDGRLDLDLHTGDLQVLDGLKQRLAELNGLSVEIQTAQASAQGVESRLSIASRES
jgi:general secretion pathway protein L